MVEEIKIKRKSARKGDDGHKIVSVRMKDELIARLDEISQARTAHEMRSSTFCWKRRLTL